MRWARAATAENGSRTRRDVRRFEVFSWSPHWLAKGTHRRGVLAAGRLQRCDRIEERMYGKQEHYTRHEDQRRFRRNDNKGCYDGL